MLSNMVLRRLEEIEQQACLDHQVLPQSLQGEVISNSLLRLTLEIVVQKSSRFVVVCVGLFQRRGRDPDLRLVVLVQS